MDVTDNVVHIERVLCLECGITYAKPRAGGTVNENPGCPRCGYVGWISAGVNPPQPPRRSGEDRRRHSSVRPR